MKQIPNSVCNKHQAHKYIQRNPICLTDSDHDFNIDGIRCKDIIESGRDISIDDKEY